MIFPASSRVAGSRRSTGGLVNRLRKDNSDAGGTRNRAKSVSRGRKPSVIDRAGMAGHDFLLLLQLLSSNLSFIFLTVIADNIYNSRPQFRIPRGIDRAFAPVNHSGNRGGTPYYYTSIVTGYCMIDRFLAPHHAIRSLKNSKLFSGIPLLIISVSAFRSCNNSGFAIYGRELLTGKGQVPPRERTPPPWLRALLSFKLPISEGLRKSKSRLFRSGSKSDLKAAQHAYARACLASWNSALLPVEVKSYSKTVRHDKINIFLYPSVMKLTRTTWFGNRRGNFP